MQQVSLFQFHTAPIRVIPKEDGLSFWVVAADVADALGYATAKDALRQVPEKHKGRHFVPTPGGEQEMLCVDEPGLYRLVMRSNKPEAEPFIEWVTAEVLPAIRRQGAYAVGGAAPDTTLLSLLAKLVEGQQATQVAIVALVEKSIALQERTLEVLERLAPKPKNRPRRTPLADDIEPVMKMHADGLSYREISSLHGITETVVFCIVTGAYEVRPDGSLRLTHNLPAGRKGGA